MAQAIDWLCDAFGFSERLRVTGPDGAVGHAQLRLGQGGVILRPARPDQGCTVDSDGRRVRDAPTTHPNPGPTPLRRRHDQVDPACRPDRRLA